MKRATSTKGIVGLGALGRGIETLLPEMSGPARVLFFTVKAYDLSDAITEQHSLWPIDVPFVTLSNGYLDPIFRELTLRCPHRILRPGVTTIGSTIKEDLSLEVFSEGSMTCWGAFPYLDATQKPLPTEIALMKSLPACSWQQDMRPIIRGKWIMNVVINSICAARRLSSNSLLRNHSDETNRVLVEAIELASMIWPDVPGLPTMDQAKDRLWQIVSQTSHNENSMARDVRLRRRTESEFLAGVALRFQGFPLLKQLHAEITTLS